MVYTRFHTLFSVSQNKYVIYYHQELKITTSNKMHKPHRVKIKWKDCYCSWDNCLVSHHVAHTEGRVTRTLWGSSTLQ